MSSKRKRGGIVSAAEPDALPLGVPLVITRDTGSGLRYLIQCVQHGIIGYYVDDERRKAHHLFVGDPDDATLYDRRPDDAYIADVRSRLTPAQVVDISVIAVHYAPLLSLTFGSKDRAAVTATFAKSDLRPSFKPEFGLDHPLMVP